MKPIISFDCFPLKLKISFLPSYTSDSSSPAPARSTCSAPNVLRETGRSARVHPTDHMRMCYADSEGSVALGIV